MAKRIYIEGSIVNQIEAWEIDVTLQSVRAQYEAQSMETGGVIVYVKSYGGDVNEGWAIYDYLRSLGEPITTIGTGEVYSIATAIFLAGDKGKRKLMPNAKIMIHNPWTVVQGDAKRFEMTAEMLRAEEERLAALYTAETGQDNDLIRTMMDTETYISAQDAVRLGFADSVMEEIRAFAKWTPKDFSNQSIQMEDNILQKLAKAIKNQVEAPEVTEAPAKPEQVDTSLIDELKEEVESLKAKLAEIENKSAAEPAPEVAEAVAFAKQYKPIMAQLQKLLDEENTPAVSHPAPVKAAVNKPADKPKAAGPFAAAQKLSKY